MNDAEHISKVLPTAREIGLAIDIFLSEAYQAGPPPATDRFRPPEGCQPAKWLMTDVTERSPVDEPLDMIRSFAMRIGNSQYPHMKLRLSRPPSDSVFIFTVDAHDAMLSAPADSADRQALEDLKSHNGLVAQAIVARWEQANLLTEHGYLRQKMRQVTNPDDGSTGQE